MAAEISARSEEWRQVPCESFGFVPEHLCAASSDGLPTAGGGRAPDLEAESGPAWQDNEFVDALEERHRRLGASRASLDSIEALRAGAACVITGQQPGLGGGPLYTWWKIAATVVAARRLTQQSRRRVVPVFWCGSDDSDFDEARVAYHATRVGAPQRLRLPVVVWSAGQRVGDIAAADVAGFEAEHGLRPQIGGIAGGRWADLAAMDLLADFAGSGLVIVDARDARLLERAQDLFVRGFAERAEVAGRLRERAAALARIGWPRTLGERALQTPVFRVEGEHRRRVTEASQLEGAVLSPSVLLRPLWQDRELAPVATVLGPSELAYQAQLAPLYEHFGIVPPRTLPRPHVQLLPRSLAQRLDADQLRDLGRGADAASEVVVRLGITDSQARAVAELRQQIDRWGEALPDEPAFHRFRRRQERELRRLERALAWARRGPSTAAAWRDWLWPGGRVQERTLSISTLRGMGHRGDDVVRMLEGVYPEAVSAGPPPCIWWSIDANETSKAGVEGARA